ncbi:outer membrane protein assembly factor BamE [Stenotrophomonas sp.]|jgi:outer membrane protein assembly factor BamE (lipoprotein component of BamABCDE complex)|uniref:outer membrane protein assembly factor BamE domain-containing protein n=1 Tax=Stenotrophomonas sp. TaxID=69392 RepID=UPI0028AED864|nr:outer membrane protein assembly factor BamE [Stenotrophomonas sp.]
MRNTALALALLLAAPLTLSTPSAHANPFGGYKTGTEITQKQMDAAEVGKTTQDQIREAYGAPSRREQLGDTQIWYYDYVNIKHFGKNVQEATVFEFNKKGLLSAKSKSNAVGKTGNPLIDAANGK